MTGTQMLLKSLGFDADEIMGQINELKTAIPVFARNLSAKVDDMDQRMIRIETKLDAVLRAMGVEPPIVGVVAASARINGAIHTTGNPPGLQNGAHDA